jgi:hypothetical protein
MMLPKLRTHPGNREIRLKREHWIITREAIDTSIVKTNGQYGETFTRGLDIEV